MDTLCLAGGDKRIQNADIKRARELAAKTCTALTPGAKPRYDTVMKVTRALGVKLMVVPS